MSETVAVPPKVLDINTPQKTRYCIPLWLRDEQIALAIKRVEKRIQPRSEKQSDPIAIVCFGPSLKYTWEEIRKFKYVMTCSGAHKFLIDRGIIPTWHVEVDPRNHKIGLLGTPHPQVKYLPASTCHPEYFEHLKGMDVALWHVFDVEADAKRLLPRGEWAITGGSNVGLRAMGIARFFGFTEQHVFGMDGCESVYPDSEVGKKHAAAHPLQDGSGHSIVEYEGKTYRTTPGMLESARQTWHELNMMKDVEAKFYGEGLVQEMAKKYAREETKGAVLAVTRPELISAEYREMNAQLHATNLAFGVGGGKHAPVVLKLIESMKTQSVLDYGSGKGYLAKALPFPIWEYDPAVPGKDGPPREADLVVCTDVLEHIEPDKLPFVLEDLARLTKKVGYFVIHTGPSLKKLPDGRNAHLIQNGRKWWEKRLVKFFKVGKIMEHLPLLHVVVGPRVKA